MANSARFVPCSPSTGTGMLLSHPLTGGSARPSPEILSDYASSIEALVRCIERCHGHLVEQRTAFAERHRQAADLNRNQTQMACLDVGGTRFHTQRAVLTGAGDGQREGEEHFFGALMAGCFVCEEDDDGYIFIDRDPTLFVPLLEYLRDGELWVPRDRRLALLREARYFGMRRLGGHMRRPTRQSLLTLKSGSIQVYNGERWRTLRTTGGQWKRLMTWRGRLFALKQTEEGIAVEEMSTVSGEWRRICFLPWASDPPEQLVVVGSGVGSDGEGERCEIYALDGIHLIHWDGHLWRSLPFAPDAIGTLGAVWGDRILAVGGPSFRSHSSVQMYLRRSRRWELLPARMSCARASPAVVMWRGKLVVAGGGTEGLPSSVEAFDVSLRQWEAMPALQHEMVPEELVVYEGRLMAIGRCVTSGEMESACDLVLQEYDVAAARWIAFQRFSGCVNMSHNVSTCDDDVVSTAVLELPVELPLAVCVEDKD